MKDDYNGPKYWDGENLRIVECINCGISVSSDEIEDGYCEDCYEEPDVPEHWIDTRQAEADFKEKKS